MCNPAPISQNGHKVCEKAAAGKNPKPGEIQHPVRGSGGGQGQRIDFTSEQAARGSTARAPNMNGGRDEIALFKERSSSKAGLIFVSKDGLPVGQKIGLLPWQRSGSLVRKKWISPAVVIHHTEKSVSSRWRWSAVCWQIVQLLI